MSRVLLQYVLPLLLPTIVLADMVVGARPQTQHGRGRYDQA